MCLRSSCLKLLLAYVPAYLKLLSVYVPTCVKLLRVYVPYVLMCIYIFFVPTCLCALSDFVPACAHCSCAYVPTATQKIYWGSLLYLVLLFFLWIIWHFIPFKTPKQTPDSEISYPNPILLGFIISTSACAETVVWGSIKTWALSNILNSYDLHDQVLK